MHVVGLRGTAALRSAIVATAVFTMPAAALGAPTIDELGEVAYSGIYDNPVQLSNGLYEGEPFVAGGASRPRVELIKTLLVTEDLDGDGTEDAVVLLTESSGGSGQYLYLAAVTTAAGAARNVGTVRVGDRVDVISLKAADGKVALEYVTAGPGEPACCPTLVVSSVYGLRDGQFVELSREELGPLSLQRLSGTTWRLTRFARDEPVPEGISITAEFFQDRVSGSAACNRYFATLLAPTPYALRIGPVGATRMVCPPPQMEAEDRFLKALETARQFSFVLGNLVLDYEADDGPRNLQFERLDAK